MAVSGFARHAMGQSTLAVAWAPGSANSAGNRDDIPSSAVPSTGANSNPIILQGSTTGSVLDYSISTSIYGSPNASDVIYQTTMPSSANGGIAESGTPSDLTADSSSNAGTAFPVTTIPTSNSLKAESPSTTGGSESTVTINDMSFAAGISITSANSNAFADARNAEPLFTSGSYSADAAGTSATNAQSGATAPPTSSSFTGYVDGDYTDAPEPITSAVLVTVGCLALLKRHRQQV
jgi:hypothetical protein